jgi:Acetyl-CoA dehydrogenase C-terminal like
VPSRRRGPALTTGTGLVYPPPDGGQARKAPRPNSPLFLRPRDAAFLHGFLYENPRCSSLDPEQEKAFYTGKVQSALWFARKVLPQLEASARSLTTEDAWAIDIPDAALGRA